MTDQSKSLTDQVVEIRRIVADVQERLDQVTRALGYLEHRLDRTPPAVAGAE
jgi:hypothetical protein